MSRTSSNPKDRLYYERVKHSSRDFNNQTTPISDSYIFLVSSVQASQRRLPLLVYQMAVLGLARPILYENPPKTFPSRCSVIMTSKAQSW